MGPDRDERSLFIEYVVEPSNSSGKSTRRPQLPSTWFRRRGQRANYLARQFVSPRWLHGAIPAGKLHSVQVNADCRDDETWRTWLSPIRRWKGSSVLGSLGRRGTCQLLDVLERAVRSSRGPPARPGGARRREERLRLRTARCRSPIRTERPRSSGSTSTSATASCSRPSRAATGRGARAVRAHRRRRGCGAGRPCGGRRAGTPRCTRPRARPSSTSATCRPPSTIRRSSPWWTSATRSSCSRTSRARAAPTSLSRPAYPSDQAARPGRGKRSASD